MPTDAERKAIRKYESIKIEKTTIRLTKGKLEDIRSHAFERGESLNGFIVRAIDEAMERDKNTPTE